jgi:Rad3-related DNA helicase
MTDNLTPPPGLTSAAAALLERGRRLRSPVAIPASPADERWHPEFPSWVTSFRPHQIDAVNQIVEAFKSTKIVILQAPTGTGKTLIGEMVRRWLPNVAGTSVSGIYACTTKHLQDQFLRDFPDAAVLKGRANYPTQSKMRDVTAADCTKTGREDNCRWCAESASCPYRVARRVALGSPIAVLNTTYALTAWNGPETFTNRGLVTLDEADMLEGELLSHVSVTISPRWMKELGLELPKRTVEGAWEPWLRDDVIPALERALWDLPEVDEGTTRELRARQSLQRLKASIVRVANELAEDPTQWVLTDYDRGAATFKPIMVGRFANDLLWRHGQRFLLMSGSVLSADEMAESLGIPRGGFALVDVPMTFPVENRRIRYVPVASLTAKTKDEAVPKILKATKKIILDHPGERVLIHTVSYHLAKDMVKGLGKLGRPVYSYLAAKDKDMALEGYLATEGSVLVAASMDRGVDLPDDDCRVQIIAKIPYPYLGDKQVNARMRRTRNGQSWYSLQALRAMVQMTGRGVRADDDWCETYVVDTQFQELLSRYRAVMPRWWMDAVDWEVDVRPYL